MGVDFEQSVISEVKQYITDNLPLSKLSDEELQAKIEEIVAERLQGQYVRIEQRVNIIEQVYSLSLIHI